MTNKSDQKNDAYFARLRAAVEELERQGIRSNPALKERIRKALLGGKPSRVHRQDRTKTKDLSG